MFVAWALTCLEGGGASTTMSGFTITPRGRWTVHSFCWDVSVDIQPDCDIPALTRAMMQHFGRGYATFALYVVWTNKDEMQMEPFTREHIERGLHHSQQLRLVRA